MLIFNNDLSRIKFIGNYNIEANSFEDYCVKLDTIIRNNVSVAYKFAIAVGAYSNQFYTISLTEIGLGDKALSLYTIVLGFKQIGAITSQKDGSYAFSYINMNY